MKDAWGREVVVDIFPWVNKVGKSFDDKPRGRGNWEFHFGGYAHGEKIQPNSIYLNATYSQALKAAVKECTATGRNLVVVI